MIYFDGYSQTDLFRKVVDTNPVYILNFSYSVFVEHTGWVERDHRFVITAANADSAIDQLKTYLGEKLCKKLKNNETIRVAKNITEYKKLCSTDYCSKFKAPLIV